MNGGRKWKLLRPEVKIMSVQIDRKFLANSLTHE